MWNKIKEWIQAIFPANTEFDQNKMIFHTTEVHLASIIKLKLEGEGIRVLMINKKDSAYNNFGNIELYVNQSDAERAKTIINAEK